MKLWEDKYTPMNQRIDKRHKKSLLVYTNNDSFDLLGVIYNISRNGFFIESNTVYKPDSEVSLLLAVFNDYYHIRGRVCWINGPGAEARQDERMPVGMGIHITEAPDDYHNFVEYLNYRNRHTMKISI